MTEDNKKLCGEMIGIANVYKNSSEVLSIGNELIKLFAQSKILCRDNYYLSKCWYNVTERMFRHIAMGRRNWLHSGSHDAAQNIAFMYSLYESCKLNDLNFFDYINDVLTRLMKGETDYKSLIPCRSSLARLLPTGRKNYKPLPKDNGEGQKEVA